MRDSEFEIKHDTEVTHRRLREGEREPWKVNPCKLPAATKPEGPSVRGIEKGGG